MRFLPASVGLVLSSCVAACGGEEADRGACVALSLAQPVLVLETDAQYQAGGLGRVDRAGCLDEVADVSLYGGAMLAEAHGRPFALVHQTGELLEVDVDALGITRAVASSPIGEEPQNPWDVDVDAEGRLWIARYDHPSVAIVAADGGWAGEVDLSAFDAVDGVPEAAVVHVAGDRVHVILQRLDSRALFAVTVPGVVVTLDAAPPHQVIDSFELVGRNPLRALAAGADRLVVAAPGDHYSVDAGDGIELVDLGAGTSRTIVDETVLGGSAIEAVLAGDAEGYAIVEGTSDANPTWVVAFDPERGEVTRILLDSRDSPEPSWVHAGLAVVGDYVVVGDRTRGASRLHFFERATGKPAGSIAPRSMPPTALLPLGD